MPERHHDVGYLDRRGSATEEMAPPDNRKRDRSDTDDDSLTPSTSKRWRSEDDLDDDSRKRKKDCNPVGLSYNDYTVGWVCALHNEMAAAKAMLDTVHEELPISWPDTNTYILGNIAMHNIVIACLPFYGTTNAATVASNMARSFPSIRIGLMVGIGGGVPGKVDIRLGDVVVSERVVQYDLGKTVGDGRFKRTSAPRRPPQALLTAVAKLRADHALKPSQIPAIVSEMLERFPQMTKYSHRGRVQDRLFDGTYDHDQSMDSCEHCDTSRLINRLIRGNTDPEIHYGVIASGNQVMRHGKTRDQLAQELDALCFEMEAAGLMDNFPCLVIRGICDYSDSHKNKVWQEYAAATAAAYAKELLSVVPADRDKTTLSAVNRLANADRQRLLLGSLKFDQIDTHRSSIKANHSKTCQWLLKHPDYLAWLDPEKTLEHHGLLWIRGKPGAGKSTIMSFACARATEDKKNTVISFFFNARGDSLERSTAGTYRSLLFQLLSALPRLLEVFDEPEYKDRLDTLHEAIVSQSRHPEWHIGVLQDMLRIAISRLDQQSLTIFVDAIDECDADQVEEMVEYFEDLGQCAVSNRIRLTICFSSRHYPHIDIQYGRKLRLELQPGHEGDIETYIRSKLKVGKSTTAEEIKIKMQTKAGGIFMWVVLVVDILNAEYRGGRIFNVMKRLDALPIKLSDLFREILWRDRENLRDLQLCTQLILFAKRPLKLEEYYFAAVSGLSPDESREWEPEDITRDDMNRFVLSSSKGLAETTKSKSPIVQFIHESVREFFLENGRRELWPNLTATEFESVSHGQLQQCCHAYMKLDISDYVRSDKPLPTANSDEAKRLRRLVSDKFPFLEYATRHVLYHAEVAANGFPQDEFLEDFSLETWIHLNNVFEAYDSRRHTSTAKLLYILAENNLAKLIRTALRADSRINIKGERHQYPLFAALANGHRNAVKALLQEETEHLYDISAHLEYGRDFKTHKGDTPLSWAAENGHQTLVRVLLAKDTEIDLDSKDYSGRTPFSFAAGNGHEGIVKLLLATGRVNPDLSNSASRQTRISRGRTPLSFAAENGHETVTKLLLATGQVNPESENGYGKTPLSYAAQNGHEAIVKLLLDTGRVNPDSCDSNYYGRTPLSFAAGNGHEAIVKLLLATGRVDPDSRNSKANAHFYCRTPLSFAAEGGHQVIAKLLLAIDRVDPDPRNGCGETPLWFATKGGHEAIVKLLLATGRVNPDPHNNHGQMPLSFAAGNGYEAIVKLLLDTDRVEPDSRNSYGQTPLSLAAESGHEAIVKLLLATSRVDPDSKTATGWTPLLFAAKGGHEAIVKLLLATGRVDSGSENDSGMTPLSIAAEKGHETIVKLLQSSTLL